VPYDTKKGMKNRPFIQRLGFAREGILWTWKNESSFRFQVRAAFGMVLLTAVVGASPIWWALILLTIGGVLSLELINTAFEAMLDRVHPQIHPLIKTAKDCTAGAVLVQSLVSILIFVAFVCQKINSIR
jgi:diacylglycerol kinase (ATP)